LSKIARANGLTLAQLLVANPQFRANPDRINVGDRVNIPTEVTGPSPAPQTTPSVFARKVASIAQDQHNRFQFMNEADPLLCRQIERWTEHIGFTFTSCTSVPWSAVFVSWCVKQAGATADEFKFAMSHSVFVNQAIKNGLRGEGVFQGFDISDHVPGVGDIIQNNRRGNRFSFDFARTHSQYESHSVVVVEVGHDTQGAFAFCIGGNESDSIRRSVVRLGPQGLIKQRDGNPFICIVKNLK
jgi:hypothetical protein